MAPEKRMQKKPADLSDPSASVSATRPCYRCQGAADTDPCGSCPLYGAYLERFELADEPAVRAVYEAWVRQGGWLLVWKLHTVGMRRDRLITVFGLKDAYPRVAPAIVAHHLGVR